jgi:DNA-binding phage protein
MAKQTFFEGLEEDLKDPQNRAEFFTEFAVQMAMQSMIHQIDSLRESISITKADLAGRTGRDAVTIRRILTSKTANPTLRTLAELAVAVGAEWQLVATKPLAPGVEALVNQVGYKAVHARRK